MKAEFTITLSDGKLKELLSSLSIADCKTAIRFLKKRMEMAKNKKPPFELKRQELDEGFLATSINEFALTSRTRNQLRKNGIHTVRDVTEIGFEKLMLIRHIGEGTTNEIKNAIFLKEVEV